MKTGTDVGRGCRFQADRACICARRLSVTCRFDKRLVQLWRETAGWGPGAPDLCQESCGCLTLRRDLARDWGRIDSSGRIWVDCVPEGRPRAEHLRPLVSPWGVSAPVPLNPAGMEREAHFIRQR